MIQLIRAIGCYYSSPIKRTI